MKRITITDKIHPHMPKFSIHRRNCHEGKLIDPLTGEKVDLLTTVAGHISIREKRPVEMGEIRSLRYKWTPDNGQHGIYTEGWMDIDYTLGRRK